MAPPFPFIVGCGRSGSTLLRAMLDAHPEMCIPGESYFLEQMARRRDGYVRSSFDRRAFERELFSDLRFQAWNLAPEVVRAELDRHEPSCLADAVRCTYRAVAAKMGATRYGDKTPSYALCMPSLAELLPESVFVHLVRDPRDVAASYRRAGWGPTTVAGAADAWRLRIASATEAGRALGERYLVVRYEDLVARPEEELQRICGVIQLDFDPAMLAYQNGPVVRRSIGMEGGAHTALLEPPRAALRDWRGELTPQEAARVDLVVRDHLEQFGYPLGPACRGLNWCRLAVELVVVGGERASLRFRRTRAANRFRGRWRRWRQRATIEQLGIPADGVS